MILTPAEMPSAAAFAELEPVEQALLDVLYVAVEPMTPGALLTAVTALGHRHDPHTYKAYTQRQIMETLSRLWGRRWCLSTGPTFQHEPTAACAWWARLARAGTLRTLMNVLQTLAPATHPYRREVLVSLDRGLRELRWAGLSGDLEAVSTFHDLLLEILVRDGNLRSPMLMGFAHPFVPDMVEQLPQRLQVTVGAQLLQETILTGTPHPEVWTWLTTGPQAQAPYRRGLVTLWRLLRNEDPPVPGVPPVSNHVVAVAHVRAGRHLQAAEIYEAELKALRKQSGDRRALLPGVSGLLHPGTLLRSGDAALEARAAPLAKLMTGLGGPTGLMAQLLQLVEQVHRHGDPEARETLHHWVRGILAGPERDPFTTFLAGLVMWWTGSNGPAELMRRLTTAEATYTQAELHWFAAEIAAVRANLADLGPRPGFFVDIFTPVETWELTLRALEQAVGAGLAASVAQERRLCWAVSLSAQGDVLTARVEPIEQKRGARGWSKGKQVSLARLLRDQETTTWLDAADRAVLQRVSWIDDEVGWRWEKVPTLELGAALTALTEHPRVVWADRPDLPVRIQVHAPEVHVRQERGKLRLTMVPVWDERATVVVEASPPDGLVVYPLTEAHRRLAKVLEGGVALPKKAGERLAHVISSMGSVVQVQSDLTSPIEEIPADGRIRALLTPSGEGMRMDLRVRPHGDGGNAVTPGEGRERMLATVDGKRLEARRDLEDEAERRDAVVAACVWAELDGANYVFPTPDDALEGLLALQKMGDGVVIEWPLGQKYKLKGEVGLSAFKMSVGRQADWLSADGTLTVDGAAVAQLEQLLEALRESPGRFVTLKDGDIVALSAELRRRLLDLDTMNQGRGKRVELPLVAASMLDEWATGLGSLALDGDVTALRHRLAEADILDPALPATFEAELRPYQAEGFRWLVRHAHRATGACLADDMGLGKTIQALALLCHRAADGPALVVAPTSVCFNWVAEARRFAPSLELRLLSDGDRANTLADAGPGVVVVCSYGLLLQEEAALTARVWSTVILDEAQAIKNADTRRAVVAHALQARFRVATTGTPIENHPAELWSLFRFLNPGLLGSRKRFDARFTTAITRDEVEARHRLKRLLRPFILRRTKAQVLDELPSRTDVTLLVDLPPAEAAFYEALRRTALEHLSGERRAGPAHLQILAEIMRLRRAACHPSLVLPESDIPGAKLSELMDLLVELRENHHRALVFSQFVDHLSLVRARLDVGGFAYQYLDGSTPAAQRRQRVEAFQRGEGDVFLLSLKAGGLGLNLTGADYVIHLDPWWNPAVEDQASDRAHRMGQTRPVTVYRLVARHTIEEKILTLHSRKRQLAEDLLEGTQTAGRLTEEDLMGLLEG